jgi:protein-tyrosine phosphatase
MLREDQVVAAGQVVTVPTLDGPQSVTAFRLDDDAKRVFFHGQCAALAVAVGDRTGWPVHILFNNPDARPLAEHYGFDELVKAQRRRTLLSESPEAEPFLELDHFVVEVPGGSWLDVRGLHRPPGVRAEVMRRSEGPISEVEITAVQARAYADAVMLPQAYEVADSLVDELLAQVSLGADAAASPSDRHLDWEGCFNVRDLGGLTTPDGRRVLSGVLVRSDSVDKLTAEGWAALWAYGIRTVVDLRNDDEWAVDTGARPPGLTTVHVPLDDAGDTELWDWLNSEELNGSPLYYRPFMARKPERVAAAVTAVARAAPGGVLVHCAAGRDRTGLITMLLLAVAGVRPDEIAADNDLSSGRVGRLFEAVGMDDETPSIRENLDRRHTSVQDVVLEALDGFDVEAYLRSAGVPAADLDSLRRRLGVGVVAGPPGGS